MHFPPREDVYERDCYPLNPQPLTGRLNAITFSLQMEMLRQKIYLFFFLLSCTSLINAYRDVKRTNISLLL